MFVGVLHYTSFTGHDLMNFPATYSDFMKLSSCKRSSRAHRCHEQVVFEQAKNDWFT